MVKTAESGRISRRNMFTIPLATILLLLTACTPAKLIMKIDTNLQNHAIVHQLTYPDSLSDKITGNRLNVSFGPYQVTDADLSWTTTNSEPEDPSPLFSIRESKRSGNITETTEISGGPTSLFGFTRPAAEGEAAITKSSRSVSYKFKVAQQATWNAYCSYFATQRVIEYQNTNSVETLSSHYRCQYKETGNKPDSAEWTLTVDGDGAITLTENGKPSMLTAQSTDGEYVTADGKNAMFTSRTAGYSWSRMVDGNEKIIAAISVAEEPPRVWLDKSNTATLNQLLAMANTGLLIYGWEMQH